MNKILVEGKNDVAFISALIKYINKSDIEVSPIELQSLNGGLSEKSLTIALEEFRDKEIYRYNKLGVVLDIDNYSQTERLKFVDTIFNNVFKSNIKINQVSTEYEITFDSTLFTFSVWLMNIDGKGELMNVLRKIKKQNSLIANCIENCCKTKDDFNQKAFDDDWAHFYMKWDCSNLDERRDKNNFTLSLSIDKKEKNEEKINLLKEQHYKKLLSFWNFGSELLNPLKQYLTQFH